MIPLPLAARWTLAALASLFVGYVILHSSTMDEWWGRPVSRALQAGIGACAALSLVAVRFPRAPRWPVLLLVALLTAFAAASFFLPARRWRLPALVAGGVWAMALRRAVNERAMPAGAPHPPG